MQWWWTLLPAAASLVAADCQWHRPSSPLTQAATGPVCKTQEVGSGWEGPQSCVGEERCIYWNSNFNGGDGIVLLTTAQHAREVAEWSSSSTPSSKTTADELPFYIAPIPGKGNGLIARRKILQGETIMTQPAVIMVLTDAYRGFSVEQANLLYAEALEKVSPKMRRVFEKQHGQDLHTKLDKNGFTIFTSTNSSSQHIGVFPHVSGFNHDCRPSISYRLNNITHTTTAARDIHPGEELTISYIDLMLPRHSRISRLRDWGFDCTCPQCTLSPLLSAASDANIERIQQLEAELDSPNSTSVTAKTGEELVGLYETERLDIYLGPAYTRAALNFGLFGEEGRAREYAGKAVGALERQYGQQAADLPSMRALRKDPKRHWSWGLRRTAKLEVPVPEVPGDL